MTSLADRRADVDGAAPAFLDARPVLRADLQVSDRVWHGPRAVRLVRDPVTDRTHEIGLREHFLLTRLDGTSTLARIGRDYESELGQTIDATGWQQLLGLAHARGMLVVPGAEPVPAAVAAGPAGSGRRWSGSVLKGEVAVVRDGQALTARLLGLLSPLRHLPTGPCVLAVLAGLATMLGVLAADLPALLDGLGDAVARPGVVVATVAVLWVSGALHELGHGLVARAHGGSVRELGISWCLPLLIPFCRVEDYRYLPGRRARLATAGVGCVVNLAVLVPFATAWWATSPDAAVRPFLAAVLVLGTVLGLVNLVPLAPLDGYVLLTHATGTLGLTAASQGYATLAVGARLGGRRATDQRLAVARYPRGLRRLYAAYALASPLIVLACAAFAVWVAASVIPDAAGPWRWAGPLAVAVLVVAGLATTQRSRT
ncbi:M50 family metallopeptidase [Nocardioides dongxiaopingii]|uniref:M50 family metallopeptidase n=1 Tax=Nocardioides sp. S-1144 TaxID=2582905 RepID=UPI00110EB14D|nr:M50 family metallopeptidase [Nocardioides sp. S-1144]QCW49583.1 M50 family metallopeptidase [Nocardioides sp. S-1144]